MGGGTVPRSKVGWPISDCEGTDDSKPAPGDEADTLCSCRQEKPLLDLFGLCGSEGSGRSGPACEASPTRTPRTGFSDVWRSSFWRRWALWIRQPLEGLGPQPFHPIHPTPVAFPCERKYRTALESCNVDRRRWRVLPSGHCFDLQVDQA